MASTWRRRGSLAVLAVIPSLAAPHGGISAIGALLPVYIALWSVGLMLSIWVIHSLAMLLLSAGSLTGRMQNIYKYLSFALVGVFIFLGIVGAAYFTAIASVIALLAAIVVGFIAILIHGHNERRMARL